MRCLNCPLFKTRISHFAHGSSVEAGHSHSIVGAAYTGAYHAHAVHRGALLCMRHTPTYATAAVAE